MLDRKALVRQPLSIGTTAADMRRVTQLFIPGSAVRGAYAARWLAEHGDHQQSPARRQAFIDLFERPEVRYGPLFAPGGKPASLAMLQHKYGAREDCTRRTWNVAVDPGADVGQCPDCGQELALSRGEIDGVATSDRIRVALADNETARPGQLHSREAIDAGIALSGYLRGDDPWLATVTRLRIGGKRSTSGAVTVTATPLADPPVPTLLADGQTIVIWLAGPAVFVDNFGRPLDRPTDHELSDLLGIDATVETAWARQTRVGGWHLASGLPKPVEIAVQPGSTYRIRCRGSVPAEGLRRLAEIGLGLRRNEGFGWVGPPPDVERTDKDSDVTMIGTR
jgi:CRISPR-associated protein Csx10